MNGRHFRWPSRPFQSICLQEQHVAIERILQERQAETLHQTGSDRNPPLGNNRLGCAAECKEAARLPAWYHQKSDGMIMAQVVPNDR